MTILPDYRANRPQYTGCTTAGEPCAEHGSSELRLYSAPDENAPLIKDIGLRPQGDPRRSTSTTWAHAYHRSAYAVADHDGDWTAIWYLGQKAWFHDRRDGARP